MVRAKLACRGVALTGTDEDCWLVRLQAMAILSLLEVNLKWAYNVPFAARNRHAEIKSLGVGRRNTSAASAGRSPESRGGLFARTCTRIQVNVNGDVQRMRVCVQCIRSGRVQRPQKQKPFQMPSL